MSQMTLLNFTFAEPFESVTLISTGIAWDLHNWADFQGLAFNAADASLDLHWLPAPASESGRDGSISPEGSDVTVSEFHLVFRDVQFLRMGPPDKAVAFPENEATLQGVSFVRPGDTAPNLRVADPSVDEFHLFFKFISGRTLEIGAEIGEFVVGGQRK
jgi:hypothetical protein